MIDVYTANEHNPLAPWNDSFPGAPVYEQPSTGRLAAGQKLIAEAIDRMVAAGMKPVVLTTSVQL